MGFKFLIFGGIGILFSICFEIIRKQVKNCTIKNMEINVIDYTLKDTVGLLSVELSFNATNGYNYTGCIDYNLKGKRLEDFLSAEKEYSKKLLKFWIGEDFYANYYAYLANSDKIIDYVRSKEWNQAKTIENNV